MNKMMILIIFILLCAVLYSCSKQGKDKEVIKNFFLELKEDSSDNDSLYNKYFVTATYNGEGRSTEDVRYYIDTILPALKSKIAVNSVEIISLKEGLKKYPSANFYRNYYDGQDKQIYICNFNTIPSDTSVVYVLMYDHKIISTKPSTTMEGKIIQWF